MSSWPSYFYPRSPCGERLFRPRSGQAYADFYPRSPCGERLGSYHFLVFHHAISIHALLAESDRKRNAAVTRPKRISIHALLAESDVHHKQHITPHNVFLSTLSLRRATSALQSLAGPGRYFYPRSPCGERPPRMISSIRSISISIHALLAESDSFRDQFTYSLSIFLSTLSLRRATFDHLQICLQAGISIHALLAESDITAPTSSGKREDFYPRSPCGERPSKTIQGSLSVYFYPRSPCGERPVRVVRTCWSPYFYPRSPCGERHGQDVLLPAALEFLSTLSLRRATKKPPLIVSANPPYFYPRSPCGERPGNASGIHTHWISIHALLAESDALIPHQQKCGNRFLSTLSLRRATVTNNARNTKL